MEPVILDLVNIVGIGLTGLLVGFFAGSVFEAWASYRRKARKAAEDLKARQKLQLELLWQEREIKQMVEQVEIR